MHPSCNFTFKTAELRPIVAKHCHMIDVDSDSQESRAIAFAGRTGFHCDRMAFELNNRKYHARIWGC